MLIYQQSTITDQLNVIIDATVPAGITMGADVVLEKTIVSGATVVSASFASASSTLNINGTAITDWATDKVTISGQAALTGGSNATVAANITLPLTVVSSVTATSDSGVIKVVTNNTSTTFQIPGWGDKIGSLTAGSFIEITGSGDSRTIAVTGLGTAATYSSDAFATSAQGTKADTAIQSIAESTINGKIKFTSDGTTYTEVPVHGLGTAAFKDTDYFLAAGATAVNASSLGGQSPAYYTNVQSDWSQTDSTAADYIKGKPTIPAAQVNSDWNASSGVSQILNKPNLATVATSGSYDDLTNKPTIPTTYIQSALASGNTLTLTNQAGTTITFSPEIPDGAIAYAGGHGSVLQKVTSIPGESTVRTNEINTITNFGAVLGERNYLGYTTDDNWSTFTVDETHGSNGTAVVGGANVVSQTEDALVSGYKNRTFSAHQSIIGGYKNKVYASESAVFGEKHTINGALYEAEGAIKTNTRKIAVFGGENTIGVGCQWDLVAGQSITINQYGKWVFSVGAKNRMDNSNEAVNQLGWNNQTGTYITDSTQIGYDNMTGNGASNNKLFNIVQIGHSNYSNKSETYMLGYNLTTQHTSQVILGRFNADVSSKDVLVVGCGHAADTDHGISELQENCFTAGKDGDDNKYIKIGGTTLTETQLQSLLAIINSSSSSSSGSYDHNFGGDATPEVN